MLHAKSTSKLANWRTRLATWTATIALHTLGTSTFFIGTWWIMIPTETRQALREAYHFGAIQAQSTELLLHAGLSACFWAMLVIGYKLLTTPTKTSPRLVSARGTVIVETLIVFPIFLLLTLGLIQLVIINTAGLLTTLAAFQAGRTAMVWQPEIGQPGVNPSFVTDKARVAAAGALAPVAPSDFAFDCSTSSTFDARSNAMVNAGHLKNFDLEKAHANRPNLTVSRAFDEANFALRGHRKLGFAYCATDVSIKTHGKTLTATVDYKHQMAMPIVEVVFGRLDEVGGRSGFYSTISRAHVVTPQIEPFRDAPGYQVGGILGKILDFI